MEQVRDRTFGQGEIVDSDGRVFSQCHFAGAQLRYAGGELPVFDDCTFESVRWYFQDAALRTIQLLQVTGNAEGGRPFIDALFRPGNYIGG